MSGRTRCCFPAVAKGPASPVAPPADSPTPPSTPAPATGRPAARAGDSESLKISLTHVHRYDLWLLGVWPVGKRKGMRCGSRAIYERMVARLSRLLQRGRGEGLGDEAAVDPALRRFAGADLAGLTILSGPYAPPPPPPPPPGHGHAAPLALPAPGSLPPTPHAATH